MRNDHYILNAGGEPVAEPDFFKWAAWFERSGDERRVAQTVVGDVCVSTVFLALDHSFGEGPPVLWETMIFRAGRAEEMRRYTSRADAVRGHEELAACVAAAEAWGTVLLEPDEWPEEIEAG
jgi:hypothetical protein